MGKNSRKSVQKEKKSSITSKQFDDDENLPLSKLVHTIDKNDSCDSSEKDLHKQQSTPENYDHHPLRKINTNVSYEIMSGFRHNSKILFCPDEQS